ncbi:MAG: hypothetical protein IJE28_03520, partial [Oscillospiraceae bacterium]|nr:hypothetical protein [Oscillospiraceae bacterium]
LVGKVSAKQTDAVFHRLPPGEIAFPEGKVSAKQTEGCQFHPIKNGRMISAPTVKKTSLVQWEVSPKVTEGL